MQIRYGFDIEIQLTQPTHLITLMDVFPDRRIDVVSERPLHVSGGETAELYADAFGNTCRRITGHPGRVQITSEGLIVDSGFPDPIPPYFADLAVEELPNDALQFLLASRYCETDLLTTTAWNLFGGISGATAKVQAINDYVHARLQFDYASARNTRTAWEAFNKGIGVCRDFTHLAVAFCRCLNIPARYCNGYLGDIGVPPDPAPMDFNAWYEVFLGGRWYTFDARHNMPRIGRILIARGRDAMDIPMLHTFGPHVLGKFTVITEEVFGSPIQS